MSHKVVGHWRVMGLSSYNNINNSNIKVRGAKLRKNVMVRLGAKRDGEAFILTLYFGWDDSTREKDVVEVRLNYLLHIEDVPKGITVDLAEILSEPEAVTSAALANRAELRVDWCLAEPSLYLTISLHQNFAEVYRRRLRSFFVIPRSVNPSRKNYSAPA